MDSQQDFLRDAMRRLNLTRDAFAERLGVRRRTLDTWLLPEASGEARAMPDMAQKFVSEILFREAEGHDAQKHQRPLAERSKGQSWKLMTQRLGDWSGRLFRSSPFR